MALPTALSLVDQTNFPELWRTQRTDRRQDERDGTLAEALRRLETRAAADGYADIHGFSPNATANIGEGPIAGAFVWGTGLLGSRGAQATLVHGTGDAALTFEAVVPGTPGNDISVTITETGALTVTADVAAQTLVITSNSTNATGIAAAVNADAAAKFLVNVTAGGTGLGLPADLTATDMAGGAGGTFSLDVGAFPVDGETVGWGITSWTNTAITFDFDPSDTDGVGTDMTPAFHGVFVVSDGYKQFVGTVTARQTKEMAINLSGGAADGGAWAWVPAATGLGALTRTAAVASESFWVTLPVEAAGAGNTVTVLGVDANYSVDTDDLDDVRFELWIETQGDDGSAPTAAVAMGEDDADYDDDHNTSTERGDDTAGPELHKVVMRNAGAKVTVAEGDVLKLRIFCDGDAGGAGILAVQNAKLIYAD